MALSYRSFTLVDPLCVNVPSPCGTVRVCSYACVSVGVCETTIAKMVPILSLDIPTRATCRPLKQLWPSRLEFDSPTALCRRPWKYKLAPYKFTSFVTTAFALAVVCRLMSL